MIEFSRSDSPLSMLSPFNNNVPRNNDNADLMTTNGDNMMAPAGNSDNSLNNVGVGDGLPNDIMASVSPSGASNGINEGNGIIDMTDAVDNNGTSQNALGPSMRSNPFIAISDPSNVVTNSSRETLHRSGLLGTTGTGELICRDYT